MNYSAIRSIVGTMLKFEAAFFLVPIITSVVYGEHQGLAYFGVAFVCLVLGILLSNKKEDQILYAKEGFYAVALCWIVLSLFGAIPFVITGEIPNYVDALFETVSGFTTTGSSILTDVEVLSHTSLIWRSFTHWVGGMGVIVFILAIIPSKGGYNMNLMKAESPGPSVSKLVPRLRDTSFILYGIYLGLTVLLFLSLVIAGMPVFDSICVAIGTAGTGGFGIKNTSLAGPYYTPVQQIITAVFMILFGINFNAYFYLLGKNKKDAFKMEEVRCYLGIVLFATLIIAVNIVSMYSGFGEALRHSLFQVASVITTSGFATTDFNLWPQLSKSIMLLLMFFGACAGSTGGGIKVSRIVIMLKSVKREIYHIISPRSIQSVRFDGEVLDKETTTSVGRYFLTYLVVFALSVLLVSLDGFDFETTFTSVVATINNIGPGFGIVGATGNFSTLSAFSKIILMFDMLAGRLELYPMLILFAPTFWKSRRYS